jgi:uncharacterized phage protein (TIGR02218 family)
MSGTVSTTVSSNAFTDTSKNQPDDWWRSGKVTWTSGLNNTLSMETKDSTSGGLITLFQAMPYAISPGDTYSLTVGCMKRQIEDCKNKFANGINYQGFPDVPTQDQSTKFGGQ